ncbi:MAG TPA: MauE/DoxX family redox-associated membrane protein [Jatrophihabitans sp.]|nr:MauE/DoxX family redox-associated membrane protein [Jatrophihabitans sp.]
MQYLAIACRAAIAVVFALAVGGKLVGRGAFAEFVGSVAALKLVRPGLARITAAATVAAEFSTVVLVLLPAAASAMAGCALGAGLTLAFAVTIVRNLRTGNRTPCRCFGRSSVPLGGRHLVRNTILLLVCLAGLILSASGGEIRLAAGSVAVLGGLFVGLVIAGFDSIAELLAG